VLQKPTTKLQIEKEDNPMQVVREVSNVVENGSYKTKS
jgi:hypothetical protein